MKKKPPLKLGLILLSLEAIFLIMTAIVLPPFAAKLVSMITANHVGGRLAFIAIGLESGLNSSMIIPIIIYHNTTYLLIMYSLFVLVSEKALHFKPVAGYISGMKKKADERRKSFKRLSRFGIFFFVWVPLPWTGAVIGSYLAHLEGYSRRNTMITVIPAMWFGVVTWTIWFDELYEFIEGFGRTKTMFLTVFLMALPLLMLAFDRIVKAARLKKKKLSHSG